jgi:hypothetical protein
LSECAFETIQPPKPFQAEYKVRLPPVTSGVKLIKNHRFEIIEAAG